MLTGNFIPLLITCAIIIFLGLVIAVANSVRMRIRLAFEVICAGLVFWQLTVYISDRVTSHLYLWNSLVFVGPTVAVLGSFYFIKQLTASSDDHAESLMSHVSTMLNYAAAISAALQIIVVASGKIFQNITYYQSTYSYDRGVLYVVYIIGLVVLMLALIAQLLINRKMSPLMSHQRQVSNTILATFAIAFAVGLITNVVVPTVTKSEDVIGLGLLSVNVFAIGLAWSIIRYRFLDIHFFVVRAAAYLMTLLVMTFALVLPVVIIFGYILGFHLSKEKLIAIVPLSVCALYVLQYIRTTFDRVTTKIFFRNFYDLQDVLDKISGVLVRTADIEVLRNETAILIQEALKANSLKYVLFADKSEQNVHIVKKFAAHRDSMTNIVDMDAIKSRGKYLSLVAPGEDIALAVKLRTTDGILGYMLLGHKKSGETYANRDKRLLSIAADEIAISMQNALQFKEIQRFNITLQQKVEEATKELRATNQKLKILDETKDDFISMSSHQLRTPLTSVKGYISLVLDGDAGKITLTQRKLLSQAYISSQRMVYLIADLLDVSRLRTGKFVIEPKEVNLADVIQGEVDQLVETAKGRSLTLKYAKPEHFPTTWIDETKTRQVIMNFIDNAIYYTPAGGQIDIILSETPKSIEFKVVDNGIGVPKAERYHLFSKFYRAKNAQKARPDGTGLGLFMAKKVIVAQGGAVIFQSTEGIGSTFGFTFPKSKVTSTPVASD